MESGNRIRSASREGSLRSAHASSTSEPDIDGPPMYVPSLEFDVHSGTTDSSNDSQFIVEEHKSTHRRGNFDDDSANEVGDDSEEKDETELPRTRARSKSVNEKYSPVGNYGGITSVNPEVIQQIKASSAGGDSHSVTGPKAIERLPEKRGPLPSREVEVLQKGVEEHSRMTRKPESLQEEREEKIAAEEERMGRMSLPPSRRSTVDYRRCKILLLGDSGVGKSSLIYRWTLDKFSTDLIGTVGVDYKKREIVIDGDKVQVQVWDTAGQEQFHQITKSYYKAVHGIMLVFDVSDKASQDHVQYWVDNIKKHAEEIVHLAIIGNKIDLRASNPTCVDKAFGQNLSTKYGIPYFETSAKDSQNVDNAFRTLITEIIKNCLPFESPSNSRTRRLTEGTRTGPSSKGSSIGLPSLSERKLSTSYSQKATDRSSCTVT